ncbi:MAG: hypothetical protein HYU77_08150 [Betaproteobacteria bacterium]|nr:hypothetical protein [Betaproteobacteria bacterium]
MLTFLLAPAIMRRRGDRGAGTDQAIEHMLHRIQVPLTAASVALLAAVIAIPVAERLL